MGRGIPGLRAGAALRRAAGPGGTRLPRPPRHPPATLSLPFPLCHRVNSGLWQAGSLPSCRSDACRGHGNWLSQAVESAACSQSRASSAGCALPTSRHSHRQPGLPTAACIHSFSHFLVSVTTGNTETAYGVSVLLWEKTK